MIDKTQLGEDVKGTIMQKNTQDFYPENPTEHSAKYSVPRARIAEGPYPKDTIIQESVKDFYPENPVEQVVEHADSRAGIASGSYPEKTIIQENAEDFYPENPVINDSIEEGSPGYKSCESSQSDTTQRVLYTKQEAQEGLLSEFGYKDNVTGGEEMARRALLEGRFSDEDLTAILDACEFGHQRRRPGVHVQGEEERCVLGYNAFGKFHGVTKRTGVWSYLTRYVNKFLQTRGHDAGATWTSLSISLNAPAEVHTDRNNLPGSYNVMWTGGQHHGGGLWIADGEGKVLRRDSNGETVPGRTLETKGNVTTCDPKRKHASEPWTGRRWSVVAYVARSFPYASKVSRRVLSKLGFPTPDATDIRRFRQVEEASHQRGTTTMRPRRSVQRGLWKNVAAIYMMMTTALATMDSFAKEYVEPRVGPNVALLEVGDVTATCHLVGLCPENIEVAEPILYNDLDGADELPDCNLGPIEVGTIKHEPGELWVHVSRDWLVPTIKDDVERAIERQLRDGRSVVLQRSHEEPALWEEATSGWKEAGYIVDHDTDTFGNRYTRITTTGEDTCDPYVIYAAEAAPPRDGARSIRFPPSVPKHIASSLRRLHQNLVATRAPLTSPDIYAWQEPDARS